MKIKGNKMLDRVFMIMGVFAIVTLVAGIEIGFEIRDGAYDRYKSVNNDYTELYVEDVDDSVYLNDVLKPQLKINQTQDPLTMTYKITNTSKSRIYVESAKINVYNNNDAVIYTTTINIYNNYEPNEVDTIEFQVPQDANRVGRVEIELK